MKHSYGEAMKTGATHIFLILSALIILDVLNAGHALMMFLLAGIIPGTSAVLSADFAFALILGVFGVLIGRGTWALVASLSGVIIGRRSALRPQM